jgi:exodeoxyribonuclease-5
MNINTDIALKGLTNDQKRAIIGMNDWYRNSTDNFAVLQGDAGTGKTYLIRTFIKHFINPSARIIVSAPTHRATRIISKMTGIKGMTIHSLHGLRPNFNLEKLKVSELRFESLGIQRVRNYSLIFLDEASMVTSQLHLLNKIAANNFNVKFLYIGDAKQIPPVESIKGKQVDHSTTFDVKVKFILNDIVRQEKDNPVITILNRLKFDITNGTDTFLQHINKHTKDINSNGRGYIVTNTKLFKLSLQQIFNYDDLIKKPDDIRLLTYTTQYTGLWNKFIRSSYIKDEAPINIEDFLVAHKTILDVYNNTIIVNSDNYLIDSLDERQTDEGFWVFDAKLLNTSTGKNTNVLIANHSKSMDSYKSILRNLFYNAMFAKAAERSSKWKIFYGFKERFILLEGLEIEFKGKMQYVDKSLGYGYASTVHKAQGGTYDTIYIDLNDFLYVKHNPKFPRRNHRFSMKLLYTAISRASNKVIILR